MSENDQQSPYGRGFIAASIVVAAVLLCAAVLLISALTGPSSTASASTPTSTGTTGDSGELASAGEPGASHGPGSTDPAAPAPTASGEPGSSDPATPDHDPATPDPGSAATPGTSATSAGSASGRSGCNLPDGDQAAPTKAPAADGWDVSHRVVVPHSSAYGPATTDADGFRHCFAHSPVGAVYAAYNALAAIADQTRAIPTVRKLMLPGPDTDALIRELSTEDAASGGSDPTQPAGFRFLDQGRDRVTLMVAIPVETAYMSATLTLVWHDGDWRLQPPPPGDPVGSPFGQHRNLSDFIDWSGI